MKTGHKTENDEDNKRKRASQAHATQNIPSDIKIIEPTHFEYQLNEHISYLHISSKRIGVGFRIYSCL